MHNSGANGFAAAINSVPGGTFKQRRQVTDSHGLDFIDHSAKSPMKTVYSQRHFEIRNRSHQQLKIVGWQDVLDKSLTARCSIYNHPSQLHELLQILRASRCTIAGSIYDQRFGFLDTFLLLNESSRTIHAVNHMLSHWKLKVVLVIPQHSPHHLEVRVEKCTFFWIRCHLNSLRLLQQKKNRLNNRH